MRDAIRLLRDARAKLAKEMRDITEKARNENRALTAEEEQRWDGLNAEVDAKGKELERAEREYDLERELNSKVPDYLREPGRRDGGDGDKRYDRRALEVAYRQMQENPTSLDADQRAVIAAANRAVRTWMRRGAAGLSDDQRQLIQVGRVEGREALSIRGQVPDPEERAQSTETDPAGGYVIAPEFYSSLTEALKWFGGMRMAPTTKITTDTGAELPMPTVNDTGNVGRILGDNIQVTETDFSFGQKRMQAYTFTSDIVLVPLTLMQDTAFPLDPFVGRKLGERMGRLQNTKFTLGVGTSEPRGIINDVTFDTTSTTAKAGVAQYADFVTCQHAVDVAYRNPASARWMLSDTGVREAKKLVDGSGRPLWQPFAGASLAGGFSDAILDFPYVVNNDIAAPALNAKSVIFGDMSTYYIRDVADIMLLRLVERYADFLQVGFVSFMRSDGVLLDAGTHPIHGIVGAAS